MQEPPVKNKQDIKYIKEYLKNNLSEKRYNHSLCVAKQAVVLAEITGADKYKAEIAGLLHDVTKEMPIDSQMKYLEKHGIIISKEIYDNSQVLHGYSASAFVQDYFNITDKDILNSIKYHTIGRADMSALEETVFVADYTSADRNYPDADYVRSLTATNWKKAVFMGLQFGLEFAVKNHTLLIDDSVKAYNFYLNILNRKEEQ